ncbi:MAG TPA: hypothetical protein VF794_08665 [Archangium sp.]|jgi:hypothetical protein|uniref:hypothetical protein n=1 Tax=Archangium sp. TaxID=1872627 RepID=UPI002ED90381
MSTIRSSSSPINHNSYSRPDAAAGAPAGGPSPAASNTTATPAEANRYDAFAQSGFDAGTQQSALATTSSSYQRPLVATPPAPPVTATATPPAPQPQVNPQHAQLDAMKNMSLQEKKDFLKQFGVSEKHLKKAKPHEIENAFNQIVDQMKTPGDAKLKFKIAGKKYEAKIHLDPTKGELDISIKQKKGFFGKVLDGIKKYGQIALSIASFIPGPIGVAARIASAVISAIGAFKKGDILGGLAAAAGALAGGASALAGKAVSGVAKTVATVASVVEKGATAAKGVIEGIKNKNWGSVLTAVATGAAGAAGALGAGAQKLANTMNDVATWATRGNTALQVAAAAKNGDIIGALSAGSELVSGMAPNSRAADTFQRLASNASMAQSAFNAIKRGDVLGAVSAGADFAASQTKDGTKADNTLKDVSKYASVANKAKNGDVLGAIAEGASHAASRKGEGTKGQNTFNDIASYAQTANIVRSSVLSGDYMGAAQELATFAAGEVKDPKAKQKLEKAAEIFQGANVVENAIQSKDYLGAAKAAAALAGKLSGNGETNGATKLLAAAEDVRTAVGSSKLKDILASLDKLRKTVKEVTHETHKSALPALTAGDDLAAARRRALIA